MFRPKQASRGRSDGYPSPVRGRPYRTSGLAGVRQMVRPGSSRAREPSHDIACAGSLM
jgi:hypothetical protein